MFSLASVSWLLWEITADLIAGDFLVLRCMNAESMALELGVWPVLLEEVEEGQLVPGRGGELMLGRGCSWPKLGAIHWGQVENEALDSTWLETLKFWKETNHSRALVCSENFLSNCEACAAWSHRESSSVLLEWFFSLWNYAHHILGTPELEDIMDTNHLTFFCLSSHSLVWKSADMHELQDACGTSLQGDQGQAAASSQSPLQPA